MKISSYCLNCTFQNISDMNLVEMNGHQIPDVVFVFPIEIDDRVYLHLRIKAIFVKIYEPHIG